MFKKLALAAAVALVAAPSYAATSVILNFGELGKSSELGEGAWGTGLRTNPYDFGAFFLHVSASEGDTAYLDGPANGRPGGLGVCTVIGTLSGKANQCKPSSDDNIDESGANGGVESVTLAFYLDQDLTIPATVTLSDFVFRGAEHFLVDPDSTLLVDGVQMTFGSLSTSAGGTLTGQSFTFAYDDSFTTVTKRSGRSKHVPNGEVFYLTTLTVTIPEPGTWAMMIAGFGLLGVATRRRRLPAA